MALMLQRDLLLLVVDMVILTCTSALGENLAGLPILRSLVIWETWIQSVNSGKDFRKCAKLHKLDDFTFNTLPT
jgi:hypothetical protein